LAWSVVAFAQRRNHFEKLGRLRGRKRHYFVKFF
jgi:hypothetical protein